MSPSIIVRLFLSVNAVFSVLNGIVLMSMPSMVSSVLLSYNAPWLPTALQCLGAGLVLFALVLCFVASAPLMRRRDIFLICAADMAWVTLSAMALTLAGSMFTNTGVAVVALVAVAVLLFALGQAWGAANMIISASKANVSSKEGRLIATVERDVLAPAARVWDVMSDHPAYADVASNVSKVEVLSGQGLGMRRKCYGPKGESWTETCDLFEEGKSYGFKIHTDADDYPYPIKDLMGRWSALPLAKGARFKIEITATPKGNGLQRWLFSLIAKRQFKAVLIDLADRWAQRMETGNGNRHPETAYSARDDFSKENKPVAMS